MADEPSAGPAARIWVTVGFDQVTDRVLADATGKTGRAYFDAVETAQKAMVATCEQDAGHRCSVSSMYYGREYYLVKQLELKDIRLVYAPPRAIGNYGDDIDNFMWPRHTGDFTFYRAYVGKDGKPAAYSKDNVPYAPPAHLTVSTAPVKAGDFAMVAGYPGTTFRHRTGFGIRQPDRMAVADACRCRRRPDQDDRSPRPPATRRRTCCTPRPWPGRRTRSSARRANSMACVAATRCACAPPTKRRCWRGWRSSPMPRHCRPTSAPCRRSWMRGRPRANAISCCRSCVPGLLGSADQPAPAGDGARQAGCAA